MTTPLRFSVRADLFRVAQSFADASGVFAGVQIEPIAAPGSAGVVMIGCDGADMIALFDNSAWADRAASVSVANGLVKTAVDLFRLNGINQRLMADKGVAWLDPGPSGQAARDIERPTPPEFDWRAVLARHAVARLEPPFAFDARMAKRLSDAAIGLARAAGSDDESFELKGGVGGAVLATFPAFEHRAIAVFSERTVGAAARRENRSTFWHPPQWTQRPNIAAVQS